MLRTQFLLIITTTSLLHGVIPNVAILSIRPATPPRQQQLTLPLEPMLPSISNISILPPPIMHTQPKAQHNQDSNYDGALQQFKKLASIPDGINADQKTTSATSSEQNTESSRCTRVKYLVCLCVNIPCFIMNALDHCLYSCCCKPKSTADHNDNAFRDYSDTDAARYMMDLMAADDGRYLENAMVD